jgi:hypothetical protein
MRIPHHTQISNTAQRSGRHLRNLTAAIGNVLDTPTQLIDFLGSSLGYTFFQDPKTIQAARKFLTGIYDKITDSKYKAANKYEDFENSIVEGALSAAIPTPARIKKLTDVINNPLIKGAAKAVPNSVKELVKNTPILDKISDKTGKFLKGVARPGEGGAWEGLRGGILSGAQEKLSEAIPQDSAFGRALTVLGIPLTASGAKLTANKFKESILHPHLDPKKIELFKKLNLNPSLDALLGEGEVPETFRQLSSSMAQTPMGAGLRTHQNAESDKIVKLLKVREKGNKNLNDAVSGVAEDILSKVTQHFDETQPLLDNILNQTRKLQSEHKKSAPTPTKNPEQKMNFTPQQYAELINLSPKDRELYINNLSNGVRETPPEYIQVGKNQIPLAAENDPRLGNSDYIRPKETMDVYQDLRRNNVPNDLMNKFVESVIEHNGALPIELLRDYSKEFNLARNEAGYGKKYDRTEIDRVRNATTNDIKTGLDKIDPSQKLSHDYQTFLDKHSEFFKEIPPHVSEEIRELIKNKETKKLENRFKKDIENLTSSTASEEGGLNGGNRIDNSSISLLNKVSPETSKTYLNELLYSMGHQPNQNKFNPSNLHNKVSRMDQNALDFLNNLFKEHSPNSNYDFKDVMDAVRESKALQAYNNASGTTPAAQTLRMTDWIKPSKWPEAISNLSKKFLIDNTFYNKEGTGELLRKKGVGDLFDPDIQSNIFRLMNRGKPSFFNSDEEDANTPQIDIHEEARKKVQELRKRIHEKYKTPEEQ